MRILTALLFAAVASAQMTYHDLEIIPDQSGVAGELRFIETSGWTSGTGVNYIALKPPASITANFSYIFPNALPTSTTRCIEITTGGVIQYAAGACGASASAPFVDTTSIVEGSADATKELRFEVDGFTTGTIRVATPPNADFIMAGINLAQAWTATQTMQSIIPATHNTYDIGSSSAYMDEVNSIDFRAGFPSATSPLQGRLIIANSDSLAEVAVISGGFKNTGAQFHPTASIDHLVVTSSFYINQDAGDLSCTNIANGRFVQSTATNELQICESAATFLTPYISVSFAPLTINCPTSQVLKNGRWENGILVEGTCAVP